jgi:hypothetical protein
VRWGSRLHGQDQEIAGVLGEGSLHESIRFISTKERYTSFESKLLPSNVLTLRWHTGEEHSEAWVLTGCSQGGAECHVFCDRYSGYHDFFHWPGPTLRVELLRSGTCFPIFFCYIWRLGLENSDLVILWFVLFLVCREFLSFLALIVYEGLLLARLNWNNRSNCRLWSINKLNFDTHSSVAAD